MDINFSPAPVGFDYTGTLDNILIGEVDGCQVILAYDLNRHESGLVAKIDGVWYGSDVPQEWPKLDELIGRKTWQEIVARHQEEWEDENADEFSAKLTCINDDGWDTVTIFNREEEYDEVFVRSSSEREDYDSAVRGAIGGNDFTWLPDCY